MTDDKKPNNLASLMGGKKETPVEELDKILQIKSTEPSTLPAPKPKFAIILISLNPEKPKVQMVISFAPATILVIRNQEKVFMFSHIEVNTAGSIFVYIEVSAALFDAGENEGAANES